jgi:hypothetical protein
LGATIGGFAVDPHLAGFEERAKCPAVSIDGLTEHIVQRGAIKLVVAPTRRLMGRPE